MRGDGQIVVVRFNAMSVEVAPVFALDSGRFYFCNSHDGGRYDIADPAAEKDFIAEVHTNNNNNLRTMIKMAKAWQEHCNVPLKSFQIELLMAEFLQQSFWRQEGYFYYDFLLRDFFRYLLGRSNGYVFAPGTSKLIALGDAWYSRCESARDRAIKACEYEYSDYVISAGEEWQKIFGNQIPVNV